MTKIHTPSLRTAGKEAIGAFYAQRAEILIFRHVATPPVRREPILTHKILKSTSCAGRSQQATLYTHNAVTAIRVYRFTDNPVRAHSFELIYHHLPGLYPEHRQMNDAISVQLHQLMRHNPEYICGENLTDARVAEVEESRYYA